jgi:spermidine synthase
MKSPGRGVSFIYYPLIVLSGLGISICLYIWFRQYTLFFGMHMISRTTVAFSMLFGMAIGSRIIGRLADKFSVSLVLFIIIQLLTGLFALLHPFLFSGMIRLLHFLTAGIHPGPFGMELTRLLLTVIFLFIPMVLIGGTLPSLAKHLIKSMAHAGSRLSNILTAGAAGMLAGLLSSVIFLIPAYGTGNILVIAAFILLFNGLLAILFFYAGLVKTPPGYNLIKHLHRTSMKFRKKKIVLETGAKLSRTLLRVHAFQGFFLTALL